MNDNSFVLCEVVCNIQNGITQLGEKLIIECISMAKQTNKNIVAVGVEAHCSEWIGWSIDSAYYGFEDGSIVDIENEDEYDFWTCFFEDNITLLMSLYGEDNWGCISISDKFRGERTFGF